MLVRDILAEKGHDCVTVRPTNSVGSAVASLASRDIGAVVVTDAQGGVLGIFTERDLVRLLARHGQTALDRDVRQAMTTPVMTCQPDERIEHAMAIMMQRKIRHMPVIDAGKLTGIVSIRDLVRRRLSEKELEAAVLLDISRLHG